MVFEFRDLLLPAFFVIVAGAWILVRTLKIGWVNAVILTSIKAAIPFLYFGYFFSHKWILVDDQMYFEQGRILLWEGNNPFLIFFTPDGVNRLFAASEGIHFLYFWWNLLAMYLFGPFYSSPVFLNVFSTIISAAVLYKIAQSSGFNERYCKLLALFFLFHWDVLTWSSFVNLKDTAIMMLTLAAVYFGLRFLQTKKLLYVTLFVASLAVFTWIRFYLSVLLLGSFGVWLALSFKGWKKAVWVLTAVVAIWWAFPEGAIQTFQDLYVADWIFGPIRMALTPQPWAINEGYGFLLIPSILHWVLFFPALFVGFRLSMRNTSFRLVGIYLVVMLLFYGLIPQQQTPRERVQVCWVFAWAQFDFLWSVGMALVHKLSSGRKPFLRAQRAQLVNQKV
jgi:hypothetical protein